MITLDKRAVLDFIPYHGSWVLSHMSTSMYKIGIFLLGFGAGVLDTTLSLSVFFHRYDMRKTSAVLFYE